MMRPPAGDGVAGGCRPRSPGPRKGGCSIFAMTTPRRVISLLPSATEIVAAVGCLDRLVGRSHECDFPEAARALPVLTRPRVALDGDSAAIDRRVKAAVADALAVYQVIEDRLQALSPDLIVTQSRCEVCAVSLDEVERAVSRFAGRAVDIVSLEPASLADVREDIRRVGRALGAEAAAASAIAAMDARIERVRARASALDRRPTVACLEWIDPPMSAGSWLPEMAAMAGGRDLFGIAGEPSAELAWDDLARADPDAIVLMPCGFDLARTRAEARTLSAKPGWARLKAVRGGRVYATDGSAYFNRPGPRLADSMEMLAEILHPEAFRFGYGVSEGGAGWAAL
jgi:iron complex transport system substrate-binding protein